MQEFRNILSIAGVTIILLCILITSCNKDNGDRQPLPPTNISIDPNSTIYQELNVVGGWLYLDEHDRVEPPSRGIIVYRLSTEQFLAFERTPPFKPDSCCNPSKTVCTALIVDFPFILDTCTSSKYLILDGSPVSGPSSMTLGMYVTEYNGEMLFIHD
jgi:hypothetical protein